jgi:hypothetical protein
MQLGLRRYLYGLYTVQCKNKKFTQFNAAPAVASAQARKMMQLLVASAPYDTALAPTLSFALYCAKSKSLYYKIHLWLQQ